MKIKTKQQITKKWFFKLQKLICKNIEELEQVYGSKKKFKKNKWKHGEFRTIEGEVIEKGGVAFSNVVGKFPKEFAKKIPGTKNNNKFWSSGISVVLHPKNPKVPAMHFNTRFIVTSKEWFGGGIDVTPSFRDLIEKKIDKNYSQELSESDIVIIKMIINKLTIKEITEIVSHNRDISKKKIYNYCLKIKNEI